MATLNLNALTTLADLKAELKITVSTFDAYLTTLINVASDYICTRTNRDLFYQTVTEAVPGFASTRLRVKQTPIDTAKPISITFDSATIDPTIYTVENAKLGYLYNRNGWYWTAPLLPNVQQDPYPGMENRLYTVTYTGGYYTPQQVVTLNPTPTYGQLLPADIEQACISMCTWLYRHQGQDPMIESERLLSYSVKYLTTMKLPLVEDVIARYRRIGMSS